MAVLKRFEIWLLLGLMAGAFIFALKPEQQRELPPEKPQQEQSVPIAQTRITAPEIKEDEQERADPVFSVEKITVIPTEQGKIVDLTLLGQAEGANPVDFNTDTGAISVVTESGDTVERFFLPFPQPAVMDADERSIVSLKYWLRDEDAKILWVNIFDHKLKAELPE